MKTRQKLFASNNHDPRQTFQHKTKYNLSMHTNQEQSSEKGTRTAQQQQGGGAYLGVRIYSYFVEEMTDYCLKIAQW